MFLAQNSIVQDQIKIDSFRTDKVLSFGFSEIRCGNDKNSFLATVLKKNVREYTVFKPAETWKVDLKKQKFVSLTSEELKSTTCEWQSQGDGAYSLKNDFTEVDKKKYKECYKKYGKLYMDLTNTYQLKSPDSPFDSLLGYFQLNKSCDDFGFSESISTLVAKSFEKRWDNLSYLNTVFNSNPKFMDYIFSRIQVSHPKWGKKLKPIIKQANENCPSKLHNLCEKLKARAGEAIRFAKKKYNM